MLKVILIAFTIVRHVKICFGGDKHEKWARATRDLYRGADNGYGLESGTFAADMQKVLINPNKRYKLQTKEHYFVPRLVVFNETFAQLGDGGESLLIVWHEGISSRTAADVASTYVKAIEVRKAHHDSRLFWADNYSGQNKNWILFSSMITVMQQE